MVSLPHVSRLQEESLTRKIHEVILFRAQVRKTLVSREGRTEKG